MKKKNRILLGVATILILAVFIFPLWQIRLQAPQYPEGLGLKIEVNTIQSLHPHNIDTINDLNHYIGMKAIQPDSVPALKVMPYLVILLFVVGIITIIVNNRKMLISWLILFIGMALAGFGDFYKWEYDYGHHLNPHAAIKVPGMSYSPPLIGGKQLLNIHANSFPGIGGILLVISLFIGIYILINEYRSKKLLKTN
ncbi:MAG TPA: hypothetical protein VE912_07350 [Bacteroidales bacterium]|nr:hypothetical protein [Bacteroidales bacterium]